MEEQVLVGELQHHGGRQHEQSRRIGPEAGPPQVARQAEGDERGQLDPADKGDGLHGEPERGLPDRLHRVEHLVVGRGHAATGDEAGEAHEGAGQGAGEDQAAN